MNALPVGSPEILLDEKEYGSTLKGGEGTTLPKLASESDGERLRQYVEPDVRIKHLNSRRERRQEAVKSQPLMDDTVAQLDYPRKLWDRPVSKQPYEWAYDPRMPREWNEVIASMRDNEEYRISSTPYRQAKADEESVSELFVNLYEQDWPQPEQLRRQATVALELGGDDTVDRLKKLVNRFEKPTKTAKKKLRKPGALSEEDFPRLRQQWCDEFQDIVNGTRGELPPWREVNHEIHLIDETKRYTYFTPRCPLSLREELYEKINRYTNAGWWEPKSVAQAAPLLCIPKRDGRLRTAVDARQRNDNTIKDVTPLPDQDVIREDVARAKFRSKIDLTDAFEQVRVRTEDIWKNAFATITGTYTSNIMWIGDCNAPATFQRLMTSIFRDAMGRFMHVYLDDIFIFSETIEEHEEHLRVVFERLREFKLYLKWKKCDLYADRIDCLGHIIDQEGIHIDADKLARIRDWRVPRNYTDIQRFVGLINYIGPFLPDITAYTGPLLAITQNGAPFMWRPIHQRCFDMIKRICHSAPVIKPINLKSDEPIWLICDASKSGVGAMYGQGPSWKTCRPAGFMSKKFSNAQQNYAVHELETLAILEALLKWEDKLVGSKIRVITDHKALEFFKTQNRLTHRQRRWMDYMSRFNFDITYIKGELNKVADCLSRYYENDRVGEIHGINEYVCADVRIDPEGEDLPLERYHEMAERVIEIHAMRDTELQRTRRFRERREKRDIEADIMVDAAEPVNEITGTQATRGSSVAQTNDGDDTLGEVLLRRNNNPPPKTKSDDAFLKRVKGGYEADTLFATIKEKPEEYKLFQEREALLWTKNSIEDEVLCVPRDRELIQEIISQAHDTLGHFGEQKTAEYVRRWYWWPGIRKDIRTFCRTCESCQRAKASNQPPKGKLHPLPIPTKPWDSIGMDFIGPFPESKGFNYLWVIICRMTSMVHLVPVHTKMKASELSWIYRREIVRLHGLPSSIVSDRDSKFTSKWWRELHKLLGAKLLMSTSFHPQTDGQTERINRDIGQIFRAVVRHDQKDWVDRADLTEFAINASVSGTTGYAPFDLNGGHMPSMIKEIRSGEAIPKGIKDFANQALQNLADAHDAIIESRVFQTKNANKRRSTEPIIKEGHLVYVSTKNLNLPSGRARKLCPKFVGPYKVLRTNPEKSTYTLELPIALQERRIHPTFHVSLLRPYQSSNDALFPNRAHPEPYDFGAPDDAEWFVDELLGHRWDGKKLQFQVRWSLGDTTWETLASCKDLEALDRYLELQGVRRPAQLPRR